MMREDEPAAPDEMALGGEAAAPDARGTGAAAPPAASAADDSDDTSDGDDMATPARDEGGGAGGGADAAAAAADGAVGRVLEKVDARDGDEERAREARRRVAG